ncbi:MAG: glycosyltransferase [Planctomycetota bacterium]
MTARLGFVVIGRNEGQRLVRCLESVRDRAPGARLVYVDSGSTDGSAETAENIGAIVVRLDPSRPFSAARGRNEGFEALHAASPSVEFVHFVDGDCEISEGWPAKVVGAFDAEPKLGVVCGMLRERYPERSAYNRLCDVEWNAAVGDVASVGGNAAYRAGLFGESGGFNERVVAGEEPELCFRLRSEGWTARRLGESMALHDAAMTRFGQWWRRAERAGLAAAQGAWLHGRGPDRWHVKTVVSMLAWGLGVPVVGLALSPFTFGLSIVGALGLFALLAFRVWRGAVRMHGSRPGLKLYGFFVALGKTPQSLGVIRFAWRTVRGATPTVLEYKDASGGARPVVMYFATHLPKRSETFVYREVFGLRSRGWQVFPLSVRSPEPGEDDPLLGELADQATKVYDGVKPFVDGLLELVSRPLTTTSTSVLVLGDALGSEPRSVSERAKIVVQGFASLRAARVGRRARVGHVHAHFAHVPATFAMYTAKQLGVPFSFTGHANDLFQNRSLLAAKLGRASFVSCISQWHQSFYREVVETLDASKLRVIRCGVDVDEFTPSGDECAPGTRIVSVGRCVPKKGLDLLIEAVAALSGRGVGVTCEIIGDGPELERLRALSAERGVTDVVTFRGAIPNREVREALSRADVFCLPCRVDGAGDKDGIPVVLMEAMACGVPAVSGDLPAIRELIEDGVTGRLVPNEDADTLSAILDELVGDPGRARVLGAAGRGHVMAEFGLSTNIDRLIAAFEGRESQAVFSPADARPAEDPALGVAS